MKQFKRSCESCRFNHRHYWLSTIEGWSRTPRYKGQSWQNFCGRDGALKPVSALYVCPKYVKSSRVGKRRV